MKLCLLAAVVFLFVIYHVIKILRRVLYQSKQLRHVPGPPMDNFILGNMSEMLSVPEELMNLSRRRNEEYGSIYKIWLFTIPFVLINEAKFAEVFFTSRHLRYKSIVYDFFQIWLGQGLLISGGKNHQRQRKLFTPMFHFSILNTFVDTFSDVAAALITRLRQMPDGTSVDIVTMFGEVALDNICETSMGVKSNVPKIARMEYLHANERATHTLMVRALKPWYWAEIIFKLLPTGQQLKRDLETIFQYNDEIINDRRRRLAVERMDDSRLDEGKSTGGRKNKTTLLDLLLDESESASSPLDDNDLKVHVATFMFGGHDTITSAMSFILYILGHHHEIQEKCYDELERIFNGSDRRPTTKDLQRMTYLEQVIKEGLRLFPSIPMVSRNVSQDIQMGDKYVVPAGAQIILQIYFLHRDPKYFPDPEKFDPDRFSPENSVGRHPFAYLPFAAGSRNCIGQKFAMLEAKVVFSYILRNFRVESEGNLENLTIVFGLVTRSSKALRVKFKPRNDVDK